MKSNAITILKNYENDLRKIKEKINIKNNKKLLEFGKYKWLLLEITEHSALIITEDIVEEREYNIQNEDVTWEKCTLRSYLNNEFYNTFTDEEKAMIADTKVVNKNNNYLYGINGGNDTTDKIFLLSIDEVYKYYSLIRDSRAKYNGEVHSWCLRSPGKSKNRVSYFIGGVEERGSYVHYQQGIRPALRLEF